MTEPQVWALIGVFGAAFFGMIGIVTTSLNRTINAKFETMEARFTSMETRVDAKFEIISSRLESMDSDIQALFRHSFGTDSH